MVARFVPPIVPVLLIALLRFAPEPAAQEKAKSPVLKGYKQEDQPALPPQQDLVYEMWQAFITLRKANAGDVLAEHELGIRYLIGRGVEADTQKAAYWIGKAAAQNLLPAQFNLGILDYHGWGVPWNPFASFREISSCARRGMPEAELGMAEFYTENLVVPANLREAYAWAKKAADAGYKPALEAAGELEKRLGGSAHDSTAARTRSAVAGRDSAGTAGASGLHDPPLLPPDIAEDTVTKATAWVVLKNALRTAGPEMKSALGLSKLLDSDLNVDSLSLLDVEKAAEHGSPEALTIVGRCYEEGIEVQRDHIRACVYYLRALRMDSPRAGELLWRLTQDKSTFAQLKLRSAQGDPDAEYAWAGLVAMGYDAELVQGGAYLTGTQALGLLEKAAGAGQREAIVELGLWYYAGRWVPQDNGKARELWLRAAAMGSDDARIRLAVIDARNPADTARARAAVAELTEAVEDGSVLAEVALGYCYETGTAIAQNKGVAARLYRTAARRGSQDAFRALKNMYDEIRPKGKEFQISG